MSGGRRDRPRLLLLTFAFPPSRTIRALRPWYLAKHLTGLGWRVTVVTVDPALLRDPDSQVDVDAWCPAAGVERLLTGHGWRMLLGGWLRLRWWERSHLVGGMLRRMATVLSLSENAGWRTPVFQACAGLRPGNIDLVMASAPPFSSFGLAAQLAARLQMPYVMDYRDLWTQAPLHRTRPPARLIRQERRLLHGAAGVMVVSEAMAECLRREFQPTGRLEVLNNGFDPDDFAGIIPQAFENFAVVYASTLHPPTSVIDPLVEAVALANCASGSGRPVTLHYYGRSAPHVEVATRRLGAEQWVCIHGVVPRPAALSALRGANVVSVITSVAQQASPTVDSLITGKLFEAFGAGAKVLLIAPPATEVRRMLQRVEAGRAFAGGETTAMAAWLRELADEPGVAAKPDVSTYAWSGLAQQADRFLQGLVVTAGSNA